jgi:hypothetical protein
MGLDMYLRGEHYNSEHSRDGDISRSKLDDKYDISEYKVDLGYWRKHADLHGYIVETFAEGSDNCQKIELDENDLDKIIMAIREDKLVKDHSGFFFGNSTEFGYYKGEEKDYAISCFQKAKDFIKEGQKQYEKYKLFIQPRSVYYRASW